ncbi:hypothetical protein [Granulicella sp. L46]|jgi:hypothetical protein|uniref:hypothetical protein n=1 Tax=Granulicella sp. L46 TaxID=1641865 RepID=UPI00131D35A7|nr:hypothetical protein [Granulicella sp. L46]
MKSLLKAYTPRARPPSAIQITHNFVIPTEAKRSGEIPALVVAVALAVAAAVVFAVALGFPSYHPAGICFCRCP